jgi:hypothetical protein
MKICDLLKLAKYQIIESTPYEWECFGSNARFLDLDTPSNKMNIVSIFDTGTEELYSLELYDYERGHFYRWIAEDKLDAVIAEHAERNFDFGVAFDDQTYTDVILEDIVEKISDVYAGRKYDTRIMVPVNLPDDARDLLEEIAAAERITLDELTESVLRDAIEQQKVLDLQSENS